MLYIFFFGVTETYLFMVSYLKHPEEKQEKSHLVAVSEVTMCHTKSKKTNIACCLQMLIPEVRGKYLGHAVTYI